MSVSFDAIPERFAKPACQCNVGEVGEGGVRSASATSLLVMAAVGAPGKVGKGISWLMVALWQFFRIHNLC